MGWYRSINNANVVRSVPSYSEWDGYFLAVEDNYGVVNNLNQLFGNTQSLGNSYINTGAGENRINIYMSEYIGVSSYLFSQSNLYVFNANHGVSLRVYTPDSASYLFSAAANYNGFINSVNIFDYNGLTKNTEPYNGVVNFNSCFDRCTNIKAAYYTYLLFHRNYAYDPYSIASNIDIDYTYAFNGCESMLNAYTSVNVYIGLTDYKLQSTNNLILQKVNINCTNMFRYSACNPSKIYTYYSHNLNLYPTTYGSSLNNVFRNDIWVRYGGNFPNFVMCNAFYGCNLLYKITFEYNMCAYVTNAVGMCAECTNLSNFYSPSYGGYAYASAFPTLINGVDMFKNTNILVGNFHFGKTVANLKNCFYTALNPEINRGSRNDLTSLVITLANNKLTQAQVTNLIYGRGNCMSTLVSCTNIGTIKGTAASNSITGTAISWGSQIRFYADGSYFNGFYNEKYNVYITNELGADGYYDRAVWNNAKYTVSFWMYW